MSNPTQPPACGNCAHHNPSAELAQVECRRFPPAVLFVGQGFANMFPQPRREWWCGEHSPEASPLVGLG